MAKQHDARFDKGRGDDPVTCSVIMTCYNEGLYIADAVESVLSQTRADLVDRIIIADDGSRAETVAVLRELELRDSRILVLYGEGGLGPPGGRNRAGDHCTGDYIAILDGDDLWTPSKLERQCAVLDAQPQVGLVYSGYHTFPSGDLGAARRAPVLNICHMPGGPHGGLTRRYFLSDPPIITSTIVARRNLFEKIGRFDPDIRVFEDTDFILRFSRLCDFAFVEEPLLYKRNHPQSITGARKDLMTHHARVAFAFAATMPELLPLVPRRLSERARKLGNHRYLAGDRIDAIALLRLAVALNVWNWRAWGSWLVVSFLSRPAEALLGRKLAAHRAAIGQAQP